MRALPQIRKHADAHEQRVPGDGVYRHFSGMTQDTKACCTMLINSSNMNPGNNLTKNTEEYQHPATQITSTGIAPSSHHIQH
eukprot:m.251774 g.251774  ORF g.251774 m.251774 type:complete len:82 (-) comp15461_c0_seq2:1528-1773(-)